MGYRKFTDRDGYQWEVRDKTSSEWELIPVGSNPGGVTRIRAPGYEKDPFELSAEELQQLLDDDRGTGRRRPAKNPFGD